MIPHPHDYETILHSLTEDELTVIRETLNQKIEGDEVHTAGWMPGNNWIGTPFFPIYEKAAGRNVDLAGKMFGLIVWVIFMERPDDWSFGRYEKDNIPIQSMTYFRIHR